MDTVDFINGVIAKIGATTKRGEKEDVLTSSLIDETHGQVLADFLWLAYNPYIRFGFYDVSCSNMTYIETGFRDVMDALVAEHCQGKEYRKVLEQVKCMVPPDYWNLIKKMLKKDLDCGIGISTVNKCIKNSGIKSYQKIPVFKVAKAEEVKHLENMAFPAWGNTKYDGARGFIVVTADTRVEDGEEYLSLSYEMLSGSGRVVKQSYRILDSLTEQLVPMMPMIEEAGGAIFDGEVVGVLEDGSMMQRQKSNGIFNKMLNGNASEEELDQICFVAFDCLLAPSYEEMAKDTTPLDRRISRLYVLTDDLTETYTCQAPYTLLNSIDEAHDFADKIIAEGGEGAIIKTYDSQYQCKRSKDWVKIKATYDVDVEVVGWTEHSKDKAMVGALEIATSDKEITGRIGTGKWLTHDRRRQLKKLADDDELLGIILHTRIMEVTTDRDGHKRFYIPRIEEQRFDKDEADSYQKVMDTIK